jgi:hypothetical protein
MTWKAERIALFLCFVTAAIPEPATSQVNELSGRVATDTNDPLASVPVIISGPSGDAVVFTDEKGAWTIYDAPAGSYSIKNVLGADLKSDGGNYLGKPSNPVTFEVKNRSILETILGAEKLQEAPPLIAK